MDKAAAAFARSGVWFGLAAALGYTFTNIALRKANARSDFDWACWVSMHKAAIPAAAAWVMCSIQHYRGRPAFPRWNLWPALLLTALVMQFSGNILFQLALGRIGLAVSVPLSFSVIILSGGLFGRLILRERITPRVMVAQGLVIAAVTVLNLGASEASLAVTGSRSWLATLSGVAAACGSGLGYGFGGTMIRRCVSRGAPVHAPVLVISTAGVIMLGTIGYVRLGPNTIADIPDETHQAMWLAGFFNGFSFFANCVAYQRLPVVRVNLLNASQAVMAAVAGVLLFREPLSIFLVLGTLLTAIGLGLLGWSDSRRIAPVREVCG